MIFFSPVGKKEALKILQQRLIYLYKADLEKDGPARKSEAAGKEAQAGGGRAKVRQMVGMEGKDQSARLCKEILVPPTLSFRRR